MLDLYKSYWASRATEASWEKDESMLPLKTRSGSGLHNLRASPRSVGQLEASWQGLNTQSACSVYISKCRGEDLTAEMLRYGE